MIAGVAERPNPPHPPVGGWGSTNRVRTRPVETSLTTKLYNALEQLPARASLPGRYLSYLIDIHVLHVKKATRSVDRQSQEGRDRKYGELEKGSRAKPL